MYTPDAFREENASRLVEIIRSEPLGTLIVAGADGIEANHIPFVYDSDGHGILQAHIPRANPLSKTLSAVTTCLVIFHGANGYLSPSWYATKRAHGKVVPTWNYAVVHVHGRARLVEESDWILDQLHTLTRQSEHENPEPWSVSDAPVEFIDKLLNSLVGIEISIDRIEGKTKASQNQPAENQQSILAALDRTHADTDFGRLMRTTLSS